jgi:hypothetical protein
MSKPVRKPRHKHNTTPKYPLPRRPRSPHRIPAAVRRDPRQLDLGFPVEERGPR